MTESEQIRFIAERIMGWTSVHEKYAPHCGCSMVYDQRQEFLGMRFIGPSCGMTIHIEKDRWNPLTSISDAFQVEQKMRELGYTFFRLERDHEDLRWTCGFAKPRCASAFWRTEETACRAICLAAIQAVEAGDAR